MTKTFRVWRDGAPVALPEGGQNPYTLIAADLAARRLQWHVEAVYDGRRVARFLTIAVNGLQVVHGAETGWTIQIISLDENGDLTFTVTIDGTDFGPFTRTAAQQISGAAVNHVAPVIAETTPAATYAATVGLWSHGVTPEPAPTYEWRRNGVAISGATSATYATGGADAGTTLTCAVTVAGVTAVSNGIAIGGGAGLTVAAATDGITVSGTTTAATAATDGITIAGA
jgi:hypothetical protein